MMSLSFISVRLKELTGLFTKYRSGHIFQDISRQGGNRSLLQSEYEYEMDFDADVSSRVSIHNREEFEIKIEYNLQEIEKKVSFKVECYLFIPSSLNINSETYSKELFYRDIKNYLRFKTPRILLQELLSPEFVQSPLYQLEKLKGEFQKSFSIDKVEAAVNELKMLGCVVRTAFRGTMARRCLPFSDVQKFLISLRILKGFWTMHFWCRRGSER